MDEEEKLESYRRCQELTDKMLMLADGHMLHEYLSATFMSMQQLLVSACMDDESLTFYTEVIRDMSNTLFNDIYEDRNESIKRSH